MSEDFAIIIGVEKYFDKKIPAVKFAENDANRLSQCLSLHGFRKENIEVLLSKTATKTIIESKIKKLLKHARVEDRVIIFYAGHGFAKNDENYLTAHDTIYGDLVNTSISLAKIFREIRGTASKKVILFLDSCHSGLEFDDSMRDLISEMSDDALEEFFGESEYHVAFASCKSDQKSSSSPILKHGVWTYHLIESLLGNVPQVLDRGRFLTAQNLQAYLLNEVPITLRKTFTDKRVQHPRTFGNFSGPFCLFDFKEILDKRKAKQQPNIANLKRVYFSGRIIGKIKSLSGFKKCHRVPDNVSSSTEHFVESIGNSEFCSHTEKIHEALRDAFNYRRGDVKVNYEGTTASILTKDFTVNISLFQNEEDPSQYVIQTEVDEIQNPEAITGTNFESVFSGVFSSMVFQFDAKIDICAIIDHIENIDNRKEIAVNYSSGQTECSISIKDFNPKIVVTRNSIELDFVYNTSPKVIIESFIKAQSLLINKYDVKALPFESHQ